MNACATSFVPDGARGHLPAISAGLKQYPWTLGGQCDKELLIIAMGPGFKTSSANLWQNPSGVGPREARSVGGKCVMNA